MTHDPRSKIYRLEIRSYRTQVHLGVSQEERAMAQDVEFDVLVQFDQEPVATRSDRLEDTLCYDVLCQAIEENCRKHPFQLIEALGRHTYDVLHQKFAGRALLQIQVHKLKTPIPGLLGGARFIYGDALK